VFTVSRQRLALIIVAAHEREAEIGAEGSMLRNARARERLLALLDALDGDDLVELVALAWIGRGDLEWSQWGLAVAQARNLISARPAEYLADLPGLPYYLRSALVSLGYAFREN
jgi:hypothetical protein